MTKTLSLFLLTGILMSSGAVSLAQQQHNLMPVPASLEFNKDRLAINESFTVATRGHSDARLQAAIARFVKRLEGRTVFSFAPGLATDDQMTTLIVNCEGPGLDIPGASENESYCLFVENISALCPGFQWFRV